MRPLVIALGVCALSLAAPAEIVDRIAASVNDTAIPESEVRKAMVEMVGEARAAG